MSKHAPYPVYRGWEPMGFLFGRQTGVLSDPEKEMIIGMGGATWGLLEQPGKSQWVMKLVCASWRNLIRFRGGELGKN